MEASSKFSVPMQALEGGSVGIVDDLVKVISQFTIGSSASEQEVAFLDAAGKLLCEFRSRIDSRAIEAGKTDGQRHKARENSDMAYLEVLLMKRSLKKPSEKQQLSEVRATILPPVCLYCCARHCLYRCPEFRLLGPMERMTFVTHRRICQNCFSPRHTVCPKPPRCSVCNGNHHKQLHFGLHL